MPVWIMENKTFGNRAYCTFNEGPGQGAALWRVRRRGAHPALRWLETDLYPVLRDAMKLKGEIDVKVLIAKLLQMGDEAHNRNEGRHVAAHPRAGGAHHGAGHPGGEEDRRLQLPQRQQPYVPQHLHAGLQVQRWIRSSTSRTARCWPPCAATGTDFGIRIAGLGPDKWFTGPAEMVKGLYFPGFDESDAAPDLGDSCITETAGIGGFCMAAAPAIVQFVGGQVSDAINYSTQMYEITVGEGQAYKIPALNFRGSATGIDLLKVIETGIRPIINTGIAHKDPGVGQVGAGLVNPPEECFKKALAACAEAWG